MITLLMAGPDSLAGCHYKQKIFPRIIRLPILSGDHTILFLDLEK